MSAPHRDTFDMIPWLVNGRVADNERRAFDEHLRGCAECRAEFAKEQRLFAAIRENEPCIDYAPGASLQKLLSRIGNDERSEKPSGQSRPHGARRVMTQRRLLQYLAAAVVIEAIGVGWFASASMHKSTNANRLMAPPAYRTVTTTEIVPASAALRVVFAPTFKVTELNALLRDQHLEIVNGPSTAGVYTLATTGAGDDLHADISLILANLRANPGVRFAEPIARGAEIRP